MAENNVNYKIVNVPKGVLISLDGGNKWLIKSQIEGQETSVNNIKVKTIDYVDLGLPSGTKWATMNVGASSETDHGLFFQWGDISGYTADQVTGSSTPHKAFNWADYKYSNNGGSTAADMTKYNSTDGKNELLAEDDAAQANWGGAWRMPTGTQFEELLNTSNCTNTWTTENGVNGRLFTSVANGNTLFFPAAGCANNGSVYYVGNYGNYWSSSLKTSIANYGYSLYFYSESYSMTSAYHRCYGLTVRPVMDGTTPAHTWVFTATETSRNIPYNENGGGAITVTSTCDGANTPIEITEMYGADFNAYIVEPTADVLTYRLQYVSYPGTSSPYVKIKQTANPSSDIITINFYRN